MTGARSPESAEPAEPAGSSDGLVRALEEFVDFIAIERGLRANTVVAYRRDLDAYIVFLRRRGIRAPKDVTPAAVAQYARHLARARGDDGRARYAPASVARALVAVRSFHRFCVDEDIAPSDPGDELLGPRVAPGLPKPLDEAEVIALLGSAEGSEPRRLRDRALLEVLYGAGVRISELVGLDRGDVDLERGLVRVLGKGGKERIVPLGRPARAAVAAYLEQGRPLIAEAGAGAPERDAVFLNARGRRLTRQGCWGIVRTAGRRAGLGERVHPHVLRHSCATHMLDRGADLRVVQELLGHASVSTTQVYTKVSPERLRAAFLRAHPRARSPGG